MKLQTKHTNHTKLTAKANKFQSKVLKNLSRILKMDSFLPFQLKSSEKKIGMVQKFLIFH